MQLRHELLAGVDRDHLVPEPAQRLLRACARAQRDRALQRAPALEHCDLAARRSSIPAPALPRAGPRHRGAAARRRRRAGSSPRRPGADRRGRVAPACGVEDAAGEDPVSVPSRPVSPPMVRPMRRMPSRMSSSGTPAKFRRIEELPRRPSMYAARPGTNATPSLRRQQVGRVDAAVERRPDEQPALRLRPARASAEVLLQRLEHHVAPAPVEVASGARRTRARPAGRLRRARRSRPPRTAA